MYSVGMDVCNSMDVYNSMDVCISEGGMGEYLVIVIVKLT